MPDGYGHGALLLLLQPDSAIDLEVCRDSCPPHVLDAQQLPAMLRCAAVRLVLCAAAPAGLHGATPRADAAGTWTRWGFFFLRSLSGNKLESSAPGLIVALAARLELSLFLWIMVWALSQQHYVLALPCLAVASCCGLLAAMCQQHSCGRCSS